ncbi:prolyl oligopeptidase [Protomyces lactucae-debilis]|uniref:prolyl oligopeptidase n=1 Tax=Protomyces lactucae-debilis TaxID=2754530 RepID=A0A1Y2FFI2_PROLT|nr:prolyl oligopeptidase [Protomyces lactucae-debilis]ORY82679.1 prolyl oligopeptidase [Protomyces lactucae-debilis]
MSYDTESRLHNDVTIEADSSDSEADERDLLNRLDPLTTNTSSQAAGKASVSGYAAGSHQEPVTSISSENFSDRRYTGSNTLDEPVSTTLLNDIKAIGTKLKFVLYPAGDADNRTWDLWGPLIFCLLLSLFLSFAARNNQSTLVFTGIFSLVWFGMAVVTFNMKLLGSKLSFFQSICVLGYSLFPLVIAALVAAFVHTAWARVPVTTCMYAWSTFASLGVLQGAELGSKKLLAVYPLGLFYFVLAWTVFISGTSINSTQRAMSTNKLMDYPTPRRSDVSDIYPGNTKINDPYRYLEDPDAQETRDFVDAQNVSSKRYFGEFQHGDALREAVSSVYAYEKFTVPRRRGDSYFYWSENPGLLNQSQIWRSKSLDRHAKELFFDPNVLSTDGTVALGSTSFSEDGQMLAYSISKAGSDNQTIWVKKTTSTDTLERLEDEIIFVKFSGISWTKDNKGFVYHRYPEKDNSGTGTAADVDAMLYYHAIGTPQSEDILLHRDSANPTHMFSGDISDDGKYLLVTTSEGTARQNKLTIVELDGKSMTPEKLVKHVIVDSFKAAYEYITNYDSVFVFRTNENAETYKLVTLDLVNQAAGFVDLVPKTSDVLNDVTAYKNGKLILTYTHDVKDEVSIYDRFGKFEQKLDLPLGLAVYGCVAEHDQQDFFVAVGGFTTPMSIYHHTDKGLALYRQTDVADIDPAAFETEQVFYNSKDGTRVPMFITGLKGAVRDGSTPCLLYGYGGFEISLSPAYSPLWITLMKHFGARVAIANIRGGGEYGAAWWKAAIKERRHKAFEDFQWAAKHLAQEKYTSPEKLAIYGGSNGGLLVAACMLQQPALYGAVMAAVGVLDMLRFHKFTIGAAWRSDYGDPEDEKMFPILRGYSPLHNISATTEYPSLLLVTADHDDRVVPAHTLKFCAEIQHQRRDNKRPLIARIEKDAGHGAGKPTSKKVDETCDQLKFLALELGLTFK